MFEARRQTDADNDPELHDLRKSYGLGPRGIGSGRRVKYYSQDEMGLKIRRPTDPPNADVGRLYARIERGRFAPDEDRLRRIAEGLRMGDQQWRALWAAMYGGAGEPASLRPDTGLHIPGIWKEVVRSSSMAAYVSNRCWEVVYCNSVAEDLFGAMPANMMRWMLGLPPEERSRALTLQRERDWVGPALAQLSRSLDAYPHDRTLRQLAAEVENHPELGPLYRGYLDPYVHPDNTHRLMVHARTGVVGVMRAGAAQPLGSQGARALFISWTPLSRMRQLPAPDRPR
ncbi:hypothetical protein GCM10018793_49280 [Streptomyces sulfonofaciens]|uniref:MmyB-like transcription regulator ligand binding domain-containing protein n=2 Tax=Streptomyces sulfonofaciens TaxID=68272 RepID=A0A919GIG4_9ACTN|nr:hypothetical protein GCM10018793_49280 [Streptomyces sulfonofaciens]